MNDFPLADLPLAQRLELACARGLETFADDSRRRGIYPEAAWMRVGGGVAAWYSAGNVVNGACGLGMDREVEQEEVAALVAFFAERGEPARLDISPHADRSLVRWLAEARFVATGFEMVLYQPLPVVVPEAPAPGISVRLAESAEERKVWADLEARGFGGEPVTPEHQMLSTAISLREDTLHLIGYVDDRPAGTGMLNMIDGLAMLGGDSTLAAERNRGVQTALLAARLSIASDAGCDLCLIEAAPGGSSYRNQQRAGFRVAYNRVTFELPADK